ncbi:MAG: glycosyltransferase family 2 protein [bacterium]
MRTPLVSIIMSSFNSEYFIKKCVDSLLEQTYKNLEIIIFEDCSTDKTRNILETYNDKRLKIIYNDSNHGLTSNLNKAIKVSTGKYIARMDSDDISYKNRIEVQVKYMEKHKKIDILGTQIKALGLVGYQRKYPKKHEEIKAALLFNNPMAHPTIMIRSNSININPLYDNNTLKAQDYELWTRLIHEKRFHNLNKKLLFYRVHDQQISKKNTESQHMFANKARFDLLKRNGLSDDDIRKIFYIETLNTLTKKNLNEYKNLFAKISINYVKNKKVLYKQVRIKMYNLIIASNNTAFEKIQMMITKDFTFYALSTLRVFITRRK